MFGLFTIFTICGNSILGFLFTSTNAGDLELAFGVVLRASNAKYGPSEQRLAFFNVFFTVCIMFFLLFCCFEGIQDSMSCV